jgi:hypothetical protein
MSLFVDYQASQQASAAGSKRDWWELLVCSLAAFAA